MYALFEETEMGDMERTREVWKACIEIIPHKKLTFAKIWIYFAQFEIRQKNLAAARKILGMGIGRAPKDKLFRNEGNFAFVGFCHLSQVFEYELHDVGGSVSVSGWRYSTVAVSEAQTQ